jgi:hypothetical protein
MHADLRRLQVLLLIFLTIASSEQYRADNETG